MLPLASFPTPAACTFTPPHLTSCAQVEDKGVGLHLTAALQALRRESQLLGPTNVEVIDLMLRERSGSSPAKSPARPALSSRSSEDGAGLNLGSRKSESGELSVSGELARPDLRPTMLWCCLHRQRCCGAFRHGHGLIMWP